MFICLSKFFFNFLREGHIKTSSLQYTNDTNSAFVHLTNYSVQKYSSNFSKFEHGNEASYSNLQVLY